VSRCDQLITDVTSMIRQGYHIEVGIQVFMFLRLSSPRPAPEPYMPKPEPPLAPIPDPEPKAFLTWFCRDPDEENEDPEDPEESPTCDLMEIAVDGLQIPNPKRIIPYTLGLYKIS